MRIFALILAASVVFQQGAMAKSPNDFVPVERTDNADYLGSVQQDLSEVALREVSSQNPVDQKSMCYLVRQSEVDNQIACQLRFTRSNFNFNPFGLRFGKRSLGDAFKARNEKPRTSKLLPYLLYFRDLGVST